MNTILIFRISSDYEVSLFSKHDLVSMYVAPETAFFDFRNDVYMTCTPTNFLCRTGRDIRNNSKQRQIDYWFVLWNHMKASNHRQQTLLNTFKLNLALKLWKLLTVINRCLKTHALSVEFFTSEGGIRAVETHEINRYRPWRLVCS